MYAAELYDRLFSNPSEDEQNRDQSEPVRKRRRIEPEPEVSGDEEEKSIEERADEMLQMNEMGSGKKVSTLSLIKTEMGLFEKNPTDLHPMLKRLKNAVESCVPSSVEAERCFSSSSRSCSKFRTKLSDPMLSSMITVRAWLQALKKKYPYFVIR